MKWQQILTLILLLAVATGLWLRWRQDEPKRVALIALDRFQAALESSNNQNLLNSLILPKALDGKSPLEQAEFIRKALRDEITSEGLSLLKKAGSFGPLTDIFPAEAEHWAGQAGFKPEDCVAFRLKRDTIRTEVVLVREGDTFRVVRCNNVKQLAKNQ